MRRGSVLFAAALLFACGSGDDPSADTTGDSGGETDAGTLDDSSGGPETTDGGDGDGDAGTQGDGDSSGDGDGDGDGDGEPEPCESWDRYLASDADDFMRAVTRVPGGGFIVAGYTAGELAASPMFGGVDGVVAQFNGAGEQQWVQQFGNSWGLELDALAWADGRLFVVGTSQLDLDDVMGAGGKDIVLAELDDEGSVVSHSLFGSDAVDLVSGLDGSASGPLFLHGFTGGTIEGENLGSGESFVTWVGLDGEPQSTVQWETGSVDTLTDAVATSDGGFILVGATYGEVPGHTSEGISDAFIVKIDASGDVLWADQMGGTQADSMGAVALGPAGEVYVVGTAGTGFEGENESLSDDAFVARYTSDGTREWLVYMDALYDDSGVDIAVDPDGRIFALMGASADIDGFTNQGGQDVLVREYSPEGEVLWSEMRGNEGDDNPAQLIATGGGSVMVVGSSWFGLAGEPGAGRDGLVSRYCAPGR